MCKPLRPHNKLSHEVPSLSAALANQAENWLENRVVSFSTLLFIDKSHLFWHQPRVHQPDYISVFTQQLVSSTHAHPSPLCMFCTYMLTEDLMHTVRTSRRFLSQTKRKNYPASDQSTSGIRKLSVCHNKQTVNFDRRINRALEEKK